VTTEVRKAWDHHHETKARAEGAMAVALQLKQPELAEARKLAIHYIEEAGEAYAALERSMMDDEKGLPSNIDKLNQAFWTWAMASLKAVMA